MRSITRSLLAVTFTALGTTASAYATTPAAQTPPAATEHCAEHASTTPVPDKKLDAEIEAVKPPTTANGRVGDDSFADDPTTNLNDVGDVGGDFEE